MQKLLELESPKLVGQPYRLLRSKRRRQLALQVKAGELVVRATPTCTLTQIERFIAQKSMWIARHLQRQQHQLHHAERCKVHDGVLLFNQIIPVDIERTASSQIHFDGQRLKVQCSNRTSDARLADRLQKLVDAWYKKSAADWFPRRVADWQQAMQLYSTSVGVKKWRCRWGSCSNRGDLLFNWRLMMAPEWVIDYVIVHELAHIQWMNHSADFWRLVRKYYHQVDEAKQWLQKHQYVLTN